MKNSILCIMLMLLVSSPRANAQGLGTDGLSIDASGGPAMLSSKLDGEGFAGELPSTNGSTYGAILSYGWAKEGVKLNLKYNRSAASFDAPSTVTPNSIDAVRSEYSMFVLLSPSSDSVLNTFHYGIGYTYLKYSVSQNTPALITDQTTHGFSVLLGKDFHFNEKWGSAADFILYAPNSINEGSAESGFNSRYLGLELSLQLSYKLQEDLALYVGGSYRQDKASFTGTGARGTTGASDTRTVISFPVGLRWDFF